MAVQTYTKTGNKATAAAKLDTSVFGVATESHDLIKAAYEAHLANSRPNLAKTKSRGMVQGSTRKHHQQKGTGRARAGAVSNPLWRSGGIIFGPTGKENYSKRLNIKAKRLALRQALSLANEVGKVKVVETFVDMEDKTKNMAKFLAKIEASGNILCVVSKKEPSKERAARNIPNLKVSAASYLNVRDILDADTIVVTQKALAVISDWLGAKPAQKAKASPTSSSKEAK